MQSIYVEQEASLLRQLPAAVDIKDLGNKITFWNMEAERLYGYSEQEIVGKHVQMLYEHAEFEEYSVILNRVRAGERLLGYRSMRKTKAGDLVEVTLNLSPLEDRNGTIIGVAAVSLPTCESISEVSNALHQQSELLSLLRHDIETRILGLSRALDLFGEALSPEQAKYPTLLASSRKTTAELIDLIENVLLLYGEGELHKGLRFQPVRIKSFLQSLVKKLQQSCSRELTEEIEGNPEFTSIEKVSDFVAEIDPPAMEKAIRGVLSGFKHCDHLCLTTTNLEADCFTIKIVCQNRVLSTEEIEGLLSEQLRSSSGLELASASGFGLLVAKRLVEAHGGTIEIRIEGNSSSVHLKLPLTQKDNSKFLTIKRKTNSVSKKFE
ncbi:MAG: PAS domain S-box protein [Candidatus Competibacteraceae bacterium]|nr:PAS domain S-box protein [Candidatus Competibacteraceae bacterium]